MADDPEEDDQSSRLASSIAARRREFMQIAGAAVGAASLGAATQLETDEQSDSLQTGGLSGNLTDQKRRDQYVTAPASAFDASQLQANELAWVTDTGEIGVYDGSSMVHPPLGSSSNPVPSVSTERGVITHLSGALNTTQRDSLYIHTHFESVDGWEQQTSGSASPSAESSGLDVDTGSTANSLLAVKNTTFKGNRIPHTWDRERYAHFRVDIDTFSESIQFVTGRIDDDPTLNHIGFSATGGELKSTVSGTEATILSNPSTGIHDLYLEYLVDEARFYVDSDPADATPDATVSSGLPSGRGSSHYNSVRAKNPNGSRVLTIVHSMEVVQK